MPHTESLPSLSSDVESPTVVLVVDDVVQNIEVLGIMLREHAMKVIGATSAEQALRILDTTPTAKQPDIILLDIQMPDMDGFTACERIKANPATRHIPIIFLTARTDTADMLKGFSLGAVDFVNKPFQAAELLARIKSHVELKQLRDAVIQHNQTLQSINAELQTANERLRLLDQEKNEFLGIAAHDLRNPLSGIVLAADMLEQMGDTMSPQERLSKLQSIRTASLYMREILSNLLDINMIESGQLTINPMSYDISHKIRDIVQLYHERASAKDIAIETHIPSEPLMVYADPIKTSEALENLVSNAVKYSPLGSTVYIYANYAPATNTQPAGVTVSIRDEGPGLTDEDKQRLFQKFARLSAKPTANEHSTGLGLSIVKRLIESMNGEVWCESTLGQGATFTVRLPQTPSSLPS